jgi:ABC-type branched-subunit amino acid transport system ATPase component
MTVLDSVALALERVRPTQFFGSILGFSGRERRRRSHAAEIVSFMGLDPYRDKQVRELSTGTRRITELACLIALQPTLLLLDEPSSGIAQRETEALGVLLRDLKAQFDVTLFVIEHDIPLIMGLAGRIIAMDAGRVISAGTPAKVRKDPAVVEAYLGGSAAAIERSVARTRR